MASARGHTQYSFYSFVFAQPWMCEVNPWWGRAGDRARPGLVAGSVLKHLSLPVPVLMLFWVSTSSGGRENESESVSSSIVSDSATLWTVAHQAPLSMGFSRQEYWSGSPYPFPGDILNPGIEPASLRFPVFAGRFFSTSVTWEAPFLAWCPAINAVFPHHSLVLVDWFCCLLDN